jgi:hypothetical protein
VPSSGARPDQPVREDLSATDVAAKMYSIDLLKRLDAKGKYAGLVAKISKEFPADTKSPLIGAWSNKKEGFSMVAFYLGRDGTGYMGASVVSFPILWKSEAQDSATLVIIGPQGPARDKPLKLKYDTTHDSLLLDKGSDRSALLRSGDPSPFFRIKEN